MSARVLVVDDDRSIRLLLLDLLAGEGYEVVAASNGAEALDALKRFGAQVILLDIDMPVMDGVTFAQRYRAEMPEGAQVPIIVITARGDADARARHLHAAGFVAKPFDFDELARSVASHTRPA